MKKSMVNAGVEYVAKVNLARYGGKFHWVGRRSSGDTTKLCRTLPLPLVPTDYVMESRMKEGYLPCAIEAADGEIIHGWLRPTAFVQTWADAKAEELAKRVQQEQYQAEVAALEAKKQAEWSAVYGLATAQLQEVADGSPLKVSTKRARMWEQWMQTCTEVTVQGDYSELMPFVKRLLQLQQEATGAATEDDLSILIPESTAAVRPLMELALGKRPTPTGHFGYVSVRVEHVETLQLMTAAMASRHCH